MLNPLLKINKLKKKSFLSLFFRFENFFISREKIFQILQSHCLISIFAILDQDYFL